MVAFLLLHSFFMGITITFADAASYTLFLARYDASVLPAAYIGASSVTIIIGVIYAWLERRLSLQRLLTANLIFLIVGLLILRLLFSVVTDPWPGFVAVISFDVLWVLSSLEFWGLAGRVFNVRQGKRLFGFIGSGEMAAMILSGGIVSLIVRFIGAANLYFVAAAGAVCSLALMWAITRSYMPKEAQLETQRAENQPRKLRQLFSERYMVLIFVLAGLTVMTLYFVDNAFYDQLSVQYPDENDLASFLGLFLSASAFMQLFNRAFLSGWLLSRYGVMVGLLALPFLLLIGSAAVAAAGWIGASAGLLFIFVIITKFFDRSFRYSVNRAASLVLYQPLSAGERLGAQAVSESIFEPIAGLAAGVALLILNSVFQFGATQILSAVLLILLVWLVVVYLLSREYTSVLVRALSRRHLGGETISFTDSSSLSVLTKTLQSPHPGEVIYALRMLEAADHPALDRFTLDLLSHPSGEVRLEALSKVGKHQMKTAQPLLIDMLVDESSSQLRSRVLRVLPQIGADSIVLPYLDHPDSTLRQGALVGLLNFADLDLRPLVIAQIESLAQSAHPSNRRLVAQVLHEVELGPLHRILNGLMQDEHPLVRRTAVQAAGKCKDSQLWPILIENLYRHDAALAAMNALIEVGEAVYPKLIDQFDRAQSNRTVQIRIIRVLGQIRPAAGLDWLQERMRHPDEQVRFYILDALKNWSYTVARAQADQIEAQIHAEAAEAAWTLAAMIDMGETETVSLLYRALLQELELTRKRIFLLLSFLYPAETISTAQAHYQHASKNKQAYALEILDATLAQDIKPYVLPLLDVSNPQRQLNRLADLFPQPLLGQKARVQQICNSPDRQIHSWTKACALYTAAVLGDIQLSSDVISALEDDDPIVQETALWSLYQVSRGLYRLYIQQIRSGERQPTDGSMTAAIARIEDEIYRGNRMLLTIEKVIILKTVSLFAETPDDLLAEIALILEEIELEAGAEFIKKNELADCMYIIVRGKVRVHDGARTIAALGEREVVGELALLDAEPRTASVTTEDHALLLKLHQDPFFELIANNPEVVRGIIRVLTRRLRRSTGT